jgi:hypothetical protein
MLVHQYGLNVLALDQSENNIQQSIKIGKRERYVNNKRKTNETNNTTGKYVAAKMKLTQNTTLEEIIRLTDEFKQPEENENRNFLLTGLHCCGGLSPTVLKIFGGEIEKNEKRENEKEEEKKWKMRGMVLLSCCYHLVNELEDLSNQQKRDKQNVEELNNEESRQQEEGQQKREKREENKQIEDKQQVDFPMSQFVHSFGIVLGQGARLLACYGNFSLNLIIIKIKIANFYI